MSAYKPPTKSTHHRGSIGYLLEQGTLADLKAAKEQTEKLLKTHWGLYTELAHQRNEIKDRLTQALIQSCIQDYEFKRWQRAVKYQLLPSSLINFYPKPINFISQ